MAAGLLSIIIKTSTFCLETVLILCAVMVQITMPSGMSVTAKYSKFRHRRKDSYLNIVVYPLAEDFEHSEGLCGNFNEDKDDDRVPKGSDGDDDRKEPVDFIKSYMSVNRFLRLFT